MLYEPVHADPQATVKAFKRADKYPVYVLRFRMKAVRRAGGIGRTSFTLEPAVAEPTRKTALSSSTTCRSPLAERRGYDKTSGDHNLDGRLSPPIDIIPKVPALIGVNWYRKCEDFDIFVLISYRIHI